MKSDEKLCPQCAETVKAAAKVCKHCNYAFTAEDDRRHAEKQSRTQIIWLVAIATVVLLIAMCTTTVRDTNPAATATDAGATANSLGVLATAGNSEIPKAPTSPWIYRTDKDEVRNKSIQYAMATSENTVDFDFPYAGGSSLTITIRKHPAWGQDVLFQISDGQFTCGIYDCKGAINFDGKAETLTLTTPADHDSKTLFAASGTAIIRKLKATDKVVVELPFYQEGNRQFTFNTRGLEWPPKE